MEDYVSYEQARELKECGFNWETTGKFIDCLNNPTLFHGMLYQFWNLDKDEIIAPTLAQAAKWLRDVKNIHVLPILENVNKADYCCHVTHLHKSSTRIIDGCKYFKTYESALSAGVDACLHILTEKK